MTATSALALLAAIVLVLQNAARVPLALAELLDACQPVVRAAHGLAATIRDTSTSETKPADDTPHGSFTQGQSEQS